MSAFHVYRGHTSHKAACYSITPFPMSVCRVCTEICYSCIIIIIIIIVLQRKIVYIGRHSDAVSGWFIVDLSLFSDPLVFRVKSLSYSFLCWFCPVDFIPPISRWTEPVLGNFGLYSLENNWRKSCRSALTDTCLVSRLLDLRCHMSVSHKCIVSAFPCKLFVFSSVLFRNISVTTSGLEVAIRVYIYIYTYIIYI